jgi:hypothetical protein
MSKIDFFIFVANFILAVGLAVYGSGTLFTCVMAAWCAGQAGFYLGWIACEGKA